jgi:flagellar basal-body rod modification protein FlgD
MTIDRITGTASAAAAPAASGGTLKGTQDEFLKLFMAQLQYQDPFAPTTNAEMVGQLAQLSSVEQAKQTNETLAELATAQNAVANAGLSSLVGRDCGATASRFSIDATGGAVPPLEVSTPSPSKGAAVIITDANGKQVRRISIPDGTTATSITWDGNDEQGNPSKPGSYSISVDAGESTSTFKTSWSGRVDAVELTAEGPRLRMGGVLLVPGDIHTIGSPSAVTGPKV